MAPKMDLFKKKCKSVSLHQEFGCRDDAPLVKSSHFRQSVRDKLLQLAGKTLSRMRRKPYFCRDCIDRCVERYPELGTSASSPHEPDSKRKRKTTLSDSDTSVAESSGSQTSKQSQAQGCQTFNVLPSTRSVGSQTDANAPETNLSKGCQTDDMMCLFLRKDFPTIDLSELTMYELIMLSYSIGMTHSQDVKDDSRELSSDMRSVEQLLDLDVVSYLRDRSPVIRSFALGIASLPIHFIEVVPAMDKSFRTQLYAVTKSVESIMNLSAPHLLLPLHFRESVILYSLTNSSLALKLQGSSSCHGSYLTVKRWLENLGTETKLDIATDQICVFDNNQVLSRAWHVEVEGKFKSSVITMVVFFQISREGMLQWNETLKPSSWMFKETPQLATVKLIDSSPDIKFIHRNHSLFPFLESIIQDVAAEQHQHQVGDHIDQLVKEELDREMYKACCNPECPASAEEKQHIDKKKINCPYCKVNLKKSRLAQGLDIADNIIEKERKYQQDAKLFRVHFSTDKKSLYVRDVEGVAEQTEKNEINLSEPVLVNPCSYESVTLVLQNIGMKSGIKKYGSGNREWIVIYCDGSPYNLLCRTIRSTFRCSLCQELIVGFGKVDAHMTGTHNTSEGHALVDLEFDWALVQPGPGHVEMNMVKGIVELTWEVFWRDLVQLFNFKSENALRSAKRVADHHKGWELLRITRTGLARELVVPFVRQALRRDQPDLSPTAFMSFLKAAKDKTYLFLADLVFELIDAVFMYRKGIRQSMPDLAYAGRAKYAKLWSGRPHPLYRELEMSDSVQMARMPEEVKEQIVSTWSVNTSGIQGTQEGPDFKLESINKAVQYWMPAVPKTSDWIRVCANFKHLNKLRECTFDQIGIKDPKSSAGHKTRDLQAEVTKFRVCLRMKEYVLHPEKDRETVALDGTVLDSDLVNFCVLARLKREKFFDAYMKHEENRSIVRTTVPFKESPVFITKTERADYESLSRKDIKELKEIIVRKLLTVNDDTMKETFNDAWRCEVVKKKNAVKQDYINFLEELSEYLENEELYLEQLEPMDDDEDV